MSPSRLAAALIALCLVVTGVLLRAHWTSESLPTDIATARRDTEREPAAGAAADGSRRDDERRANGTGKSAGSIAQPGGGLRAHAAGRSESAKDAPAALGAGAPLTGTDRATTGRRQSDVVGQVAAPKPRDLPDLPRAAASADAAGEDAEEVQAGLPPGTRFAAPLNSTTEALDGTRPVVEKNTDHDVDKGIYFPPDAQLAYPNRADVQGDAGTVALWVEPVDWTGDDASVQSLFRINDPSEGGYRFHLLKDSANLRFQFITENGESNLRVPIDWWPRGEGHHVAATWGDGMLRLYVDGAPLIEQPYRGTLNVAPTAPGWWGSIAEGGTPGAGAILKDTLVADRPLDEAEILHLSAGE